MKTKHPFPIFDKRDGASHADLQFKTWTEILRLPWNAYLDRSVSGIYSPEDHADAFRRLVRKAKRDGETILAASFSNCAVSIAVASR